MWKPFLVALVIAAFLLGDRATPQESKKEPPAKQLARYSVLIREIQRRPGGGQSRVSRGAGSSRAG